MNIVNIYLSVTTLSRFYINHVRSNVSGRGLGVERLTRNPGVPGSKPGLGFLTFYFFSIFKNRDYYLNISTSSTMWYLDPAMWAQLRNEMVTTHQSPLTPFRNEFILCHMRRSRGQGDAPISTLGCWHCIRCPTPIYWSWKTNLLYLFENTPKSNFPTGK